MKGKRWIKQRKAQTNLMKFYINLATALFLAFMLQSCIVSTKPNITYFASQKNTTGKAQFMSVNVPLWVAKPFMKHALQEEGEEGEQVMKIIKKISKLKIMTLENGEKEMLTGFTRQLAEENYQDWMTIKHDGQNVDIKAQHQGDTIKKLMLMVHQDNQMVFIDIMGNFTPEDISHLINQAQKQNAAIK